MTTVLAVTQRPEVVSLVERCAAAVGADFSHVAQPELARPRWKNTNVIVLDGVWADRVGVLGLVRHDQLFMVDDHPQDRWPDAVALGARGLVQTADDAGLLAHLARVSDGPGDAALCVVTGASGGVGASTFAAVCASRSAARSWATVLVDADDSGPGIDLLLGSEDVEGMRWPDLDTSSAHLAADAVAESLPRSGGFAHLSVGRRDVPHGPAPGVVTALRRAFDVVVADVPRHGLVPGTALAGELVAHAAVVAVLVTPDVRGIAAAERLCEFATVPVVAIAAVGPSGWGPLGWGGRRGSAGRSVSAGRSGRTGLDETQLERTLGVPVIGRGAWNRGIAADVEAGLGPHRAKSSWSAADAVLDLLAPSPTMPQRETAGRVTA